MHQLRNIRFWNLYRVGDVSRVSFTLYGKILEMLTVLTSEVIILRREPSKLESDYFIDLLHDQSKMLYGLELKCSYTCEVKLGWSNQGLLQ